MTECERCASLQQQVTDRDHFIQIDRSIITQRDASVERLKEALRQAYGFAAAIQRMTSFAPIGFRCSLIREVVSRALPDDEAKRLHDETEIILDTLTEERPEESQP